MGTLRRVNKEIRGIAFIMVKFLEDQLIQRLY